MVVLRTPARKAMFLALMLLVVGALLVFFMIARGLLAPTKTAPATDETSISKAEKLFGMQLQNLSQELSDALGYARGRGVLVAAVEPGSPADEAGVERGLVIYRIGKFEISSVKQVEELFRSVDSGADVEFTVGVMGADGQNRQLANVSLKAR